MLLLLSGVDLVVANTADPAERGGQVDGSVLVLDHRRDQRLEVRPRGVFVPCALHHWIAHGAQQAQRPDVTVQDVDRPEAPLEAVELQTESRPGSWRRTFGTDTGSPRRPTPPGRRCSASCWLDGRHRSVWRCPDIPTARRRPRGACSRDPVDLGRPSSTRGQ